MAKKKKHRKKLKSNRANRMTATTAPAAPAMPGLQPAKTVVKTTQKAHATADIAESPSFDGQVKADVKLSLLLAGGIVATFAVLWFILQYTSFGQSIYHLIKL